MSLKIGCVSFVILFLKRLRHRTINFIFWSRNRPNPSIKREYHHSKNLFCKIFAYSIPFGSTWKNLCIVLSFFRYRHIKYVYNMIIMIIILETTEKRIFNPNFYIYCQSFTPPFMFTTFVANKYILCYDVTLYVHLNCIEQYIVYWGFSLMFINIEYVVKVSRNRNLKIIFEFSLLFCHEPLKVISEQNILYRTKASVNWVAPFSLILFSSDNGMSMYTWSIFLIYGEEEALFLSIIAYMNHGKTASSLRIKLEKCCYTFHQRYDCFRF